MTAGYFQISYIKENEDCAPVSFFQKAIDPDSPFIRMVIVIRKLK